MRERISNASMRLVGLRVRGVIVSSGCAVLLPLHAGAQGTGTITGTVTTDSATPISGARVSVSGTARAAVSNGRGEYRLDGISGGSQTILASSFGREPSRRVVSIPDGGNVRVNIVLGPGSVLLPGVVVTATRSPVAATKVAATVNVMTPERVRTSPARTTDDLLRELPGVELPRTSSTVSGPEEIVSIRGADEGRTLVLLNHVPLNDPWGEWIQWNRAPRSQLDRVEVVEGGGSSLYGNYAMGGVISLFTRPIVRNGYYATVSGGSRGEADVSLYGSDVVGRLGYSVSGDYGTGGGYTVLAPEQRGPIDRASSVSRRNVNARAEYALGWASNLFASANYFSDDRKLGTPLTQPNRRHIASGVVGGDFGSWIGGRLEARAFGQTQQYDSHASRVNQTRTVEAPIVAQHIPSRDLGGSVQWSRAAGVFKTVSVGGDFRYMKGELDEDVFGSPAVVSSTRASGGSQEVGGLFVQGVLAPLKSLRIEASARVDAWRSYNGSRIESAPQQIVTATYPSKSNAAFAPRLGVRYAISPTLTLRGSFYQAFRAPTLSEEYRTFYAGPNTFIGNPALTPEYLTGYDGGFDWQPASILEVRATAFWNGYRDLDDFAFKASGATPNSVILQRQNLGAATARGIEGEVALHPVEPLTLLASYNYDDARIKSTGAFVNRVPLQRASLRLTYDPRGLATINAIYRYEGRNHALGGANLAPYSLVDGEARREITNGLEAFVAVENLFDRQYAVNFSGPLESIGLPRTVRGGLTLRSF